MTGDDKGASAPASKPRRLNIRVAIATAIVIILASMVFVSMADTYQFFKSPVQDTSNPWDNIPQKTGRYTLHDPIRINSDDEFTGANGVSGGSGIDGDPYIIDGWEIDGTGEGYCLFIANTTSYFTVQNCLFHNASGGSGFPFCSNSGVTI